MRLKDKLILLSVFVCTMFMGVFRVEAEVFSWVQNNYYCYSDDGTIYYGTYASGAQCEAEKNGASHFVFKYYDDNQANEAFCVEQNADVPTDLSYTEKTVDDRHLKMAGLILQVIGDLKNNGYSWQTDIQASADNLEGMPYFLQTIALNTYFAQNGLGEKSIDYSANRDVQYILKKAQDEYNSIDYNTLIQVNKPEISSTVMTLNDEYYESSIFKIKGEETKGGNTVK